MLALDVAMVEAYHYRWLNGVRAGDDSLDRKDSPQLVGENLKGLLESGYGDHPEFEELR